MLLGTTGRLILYIHVVCTVELKQVHVECMLVVVLVSCYKIDIKEVEMLFVTNLEFLISAAIS